VKWSGNAPRHADSERENAWAVSGKLNQVGLSRSWQPDFLCGCRSDIKAPGQPGRCCWGVILDGATPNGSNKHGSQSTKRLQICFAMKIRIKVWAERIVAWSAVVMVLCSFRAWAEQTNATDAAFQDDPAAHQLYQEMIQAMRKATTLSWTGENRAKFQDRFSPSGTYRIWLKKPNYARVEMTRPGQKKLWGILIGDGDYFWIYWPEGKFRYPWEQSGKYAEEYEKYQRKFFMKKRTPVGMHSIGHEVFGNLGLMTVIDPSTFHGYTDSLQAYIDGVRSLGTNTLGGELCDGIEVSIMKHQRSWELWVARKDRLPRKLTQVLRVLDREPVWDESWLNVAVDAEISNDRFVWSPPKDWKEWKMPDIEESLLKPGTIAPDFELAALNGGKLKLSSFRGQIVWLNKWRCG
jgi:outer membrane lipoprotein-sorting protein